jgi:hypothetical protein
MSADSIIRAGGSAYPSPMRRLILVGLVVTVVGLVIYRNRAIGRSEQELAAGTRDPDEV